MINFFEQSLIEVLILIDKTELSRRIKRTIWARCGFTEVIWKWSPESDSWPLSLQEDNSKKVVQLEKFRAEYSAIFVFVEQANKNTSILCNMQCACHL